MVRISVSQSVSHDRLYILDESRIVSLLSYSYSLPSLNFPAPSVLLDPSPQGMDENFCIFPYLIVSVCTSMTRLCFPCPTGHGRQEKPKRREAIAGIWTLVSRLRVRWSTITPPKRRHTEVAFDDILIHHDIYLKKTYSPKICTPRAWTSKVGFFLNSAPQKVHVYQVSDF